MLKRNLYHALVLVALVCFFGSCQKEESASESKVDHSKSSSPLIPCSKVLLKEWSHGSNNLKYLVADTNSMTFGVANDASKDSYKTLYVESNGRKFYIMLENMRYPDAERWLFVDNWNDDIFGDNPNKTATPSVHGYLYSINAAKRMVSKISMTINGRRVLGRLPKVADILALLEVSSSNSGGYALRNASDVLDSPKKNYYDVFATGTDDQFYDVTPMPIGLKRSLGGTRSRNFDDNKIYFSRLNEVGSFWTSDQIDTGIYYNLYIDYAGKNYSAYLSSWTNKDLGFSVRYVFDVP